MSDRSRHQWTENLSAGSNNQGQYYCMVPRYRTIDNSTCLGRWEAGGSLAKYQKRKLL